MIHSKYRIQCGESHRKSTAGTCNVRPINEMCPFLFALLRKRFPFDSNDLVGYATAIIIEYVLFGYECVIVACTLSLGIGACDFAISITKEIQRILRAINNEAHADDNRLNEMKILFSEYIYAHAAIKKLSIFFLRSCECWVLQSVQCLTITTTWSYTTVKFCLQSLCTKTIFAKIRTK